MITAIIITFILGYVCIAFEHPLKINKTASALLTGVTCWAIYALSAVVGGSHASHEIVEQLSHHLAPIAEILFFLMGAMTIVELVDTHQGFAIITKRITTRNAVALMWIICFVSFFLSAVLDNLTTTIVMVSLLRKLVSNQQQRLLYVGMVVIAANAGGAWSPIGDVTTTMLWIGGQVSAANIIKTLIIPSLVCMLVPLVIISFRLKGAIEPDEMNISGEEAIPVKESKLMFFTGLGGLLFVPVFKTITHLPPYMGMLLSLGFIWVVSEIIHYNKEPEDKSPYSPTRALQRIDMPSVLFFLGILLAISSLESLHVLEQLAVFLNEAIGNEDVIVTVIGLLSAVIDNVPLVAASMGMYPLAEYPMDHKLWEFMAYAAGTGGSALIIGSAAGVAAMGMEKIDFIWYLKKISWLALLGYFAGIVAYLLVYPIFAVH
ncbi:MAG: Na(+)/H(+) antiporter NhaD [Bacteroidia bacterium]|nr:Na(+)/H(+) antiporter NhaD [Bacteroidia bacterium]